MKWNPKFVRLAFVFLVCMAAASCAWWQENKKAVVSTITDIAIDLCHLFASNNEDQLQGLSPKAFCSLAENLEPFIDAAMSAQQSAGAIAVSRSSGGEATPEEHAPAPETPPEGKENPYGSD